MEYCHVTFGVASADALTALTAVLVEIKREKAEGTLRSGEKWRSYFTEEQLQTFWWPSEEELVVWQREWQATPVPDRFTEPKLRTRWDFDSMFEAIQNGEYDLIGLRRMEDGLVRLEFDPQACPFGGTESLQALVEAFGHKVLGVDDGTGYAERTPETSSPGWPEYWKTMR
jgi:hypothetical protein